MSARKRYVLHVRSEGVEIEGPNGSVAFTVHYDESLEKLVLTGPGCPSAILMEPEAVSAFIRGLQVGREASRAHRAASDGRQNKSPLPRPPRGG